MTASPELIARLTAYNWPGNVRELENAIEILVAMSHEGTLDLSILPGPARSTPTTSGAGLKERVDTYERGLIVSRARCRQGKSNRSRAGAPHRPGDAS